MKPFRERNPVTIGAISIVVLALFLLGALRAQDLPLIGGGTTYYADFAQAGALKSGDEVRIAGVRVGSVQDVSLGTDPTTHHTIVKVAFRIKTGARLGTDTGAAIQIKTLLGDEFLQLYPSGSGNLGSGQTIALDHTKSPYDVVQAFSKLATTSQDIQTGQLAKSLTTLADLTRNTPESFKSALQGISRLSTTIASRNGRINTLLKNLQRVTGVLDARDDDIVHLMNSAHTLFVALLQRRAQFHTLLVSTSQLSAQLTGLVKDSRADLKPALTHLGNVLDVLNKNQDNLDNSLRLLAPFVRVFANTLGNGPWFDTFIYNLPPVPNVGNGGGVS